MEFQFASRTQEINNNNFADTLQNGEGKAMTPPALQFKSFAENEEKEEEEKPVQHKSNNSAPTSLSSAELGKAQKTFGTDLSDVKIHQNSEQANEMGAQAFTQGNNIVFGKGHDKDSAHGQALLGHELAHVVQQKQGMVSPTTSVNNMPVNDDTTLERDADSMAASFVSNKSGDKEEE